MVNDLAVEPAAGGLSQVERVVDTFVAPSKTFLDIRRNASWWLPFLLMVISTLASTYVVDKQVGYERVYQNNLHASPKQEDRINQLPDDQKARAMKIGTASIKYSAYGFPLILAIVLALYSLIVWASFNFGLGAQTSYAQVLAVTWYAALPYLVTVILTILTVKFGGNAEGYDIKNPVGTNLAYYLPDASPWLKAMLSSLDIVKIWSDVLQVIGMAIIARKTIMQSAVVVGLLWLIAVVLSTAAAAAFS